MNNATPYPNAPINHPIDIATEHTIKFVQTHLGSNLKVLEIGAGRGEVAAAMVNLGYRVLALDSNYDNVQAMLQKDIPAVESRWPHFDSKEKFDAIIFTRSLHHISPLESALDHARSLLNDDGILLIEDFAFHEVDPFTANWFFLQLSFLSREQIPNGGPNCFGNKVLRQNGAFKVWKHDNLKNIHRASYMSHTIQSRFKMVDASRTNYLYRYLLQMLDETPQALELAQNFFDLESHIGQERPASLIGRRFVAKKIP